ncbi:metallophosphoesterase [Candidatus Dojkabacteria bacterium]|jgi:DNA repair exonuclease SbcCD nuclease subunit|nr:metallophosphoesterase [Candidatus Dojkabacteria bacterium]
MKILIIGDTHFKENLSYADYVDDRREGERKSILDAMVNLSKDCDGVVFMGDCFDKPNPPSSVIRSFTEFVERFNTKQIYILAGNHEKRADGSSAIDYLKEIKNPNWHIITDCFQNHNNLLGFVPYFFRQEIKVDTFEKGKDWVMDGIKHFQDKGVKLLFVHHAISDTQTNTGQNTNFFPEIVLPKAELEKMFDLIIAGHVHKPKQYGKTLITGSIFTSEAGDTETFVWKLDTELNQVTKIPLSSRPIYRLENPNEEDLLQLSSNSIVKVVFTKRLPETSPQIEQFKKLLKRFDAYILLEQYPNERQQLDVKDGAMMEFTVENLLELYANAKKIDLKKLISAWEVIK